MPALTLVRAGGMAAHWPRLCPKVGLVAKVTKREPVGDPPVEVDVDQSRLRLEVYESRGGSWNPESGMVVPPEDWEFLVTGQAFVTRTVGRGCVLAGLGAPKSDAAASSAAGAVGTCGDHRARDAVRSGDRHGAGGEHRSVGCRARR